MCPYVINFIAKYFICKAGDDFTLWEENPSSSSSNQRLPVPGVFVDTCPKVATMKVNLIKNGGLGLLLGLSHSTLAAV